MSRLFIAFISGTIAAVCSAGAHAAQPGSSTESPALPFQSTPAGSFNEPWAMAFLPDGRLLVTERVGNLQLVDLGSGSAVEVSGVPAVVHGNQGGLGDVVLHPQFAENRTIYLSLAEAGPNDTSGAAVVRARLDAESPQPALSDVEFIWRESPKMRKGAAHYSYRTVFDQEGKLWLSNGDRQAFTPSQDLQATQGKILRLNDDGTPAAGNPFADQGGVSAQVWSLGHRNPLGVAFDAQGRLWVNEMGPKGGDELNLIRRGGNYGYPIVSNGDHYDGRTIPDHSTRPEFIAPLISWTPVISPSSMLIYSGELFPQWQGDALIGGLSARALVRVELDGETAREAERFDLGARIRAVQQGPDGAIWLLEDGKGGRLLRVTPSETAPTAAG